MTRHWPELYKIIKGADSPLPPVPERVELLRKYSVLASRIANARIESVLHKVYMGQAEPFGEVTDYWGKIEFQTKGCHARCL